MPTNIKSFENKSDRSVLAFNAENIGDSSWIPAKTTEETGGLWISWHEEIPLLLATPKGICHVWDQEWKVRGRWEGSPNEIIFLNGEEQGVGGDIEVKIDAQGEVSMKKA